MPAGRPSSYKPEYAKQAKKACELGATNKDLAELFDVGLTTIDRWIATHDEFRGALKVGKGHADGRVERSLYQRAVGYDVMECKVFCQDGKIIEHDINKHYPPDVTAQIFWLKNRKPESWRDKQELEGNLGFTVNLSDRESKL